MTKDSEERTRKSFTYQNESVCAKEKAFSGTLSAKTGRGETAPWEEPP
jgi:hypothetical protein